MTEEAENLLGMLNGIDIDKLGGTLKELEKYEKLLDKVSGLIARLNKIGVLPAVMRIVGAKTGVENINAPLPQTSPLSIEAASPTHLLLYKDLNTQPENVIAAMYRQAIIAEEKAKPKEAKAKNDGKN